MEPLTEFKLENLSFIIHNIEVYSKVDAEDFFRDLYLSLGYTVEKNAGRNGIPDFEITLNNKKTYVEVKTGTDGPTNTQIKWVLDNPQEKVILFYLNQTTQKEKHLREREKEEKFKEIQEEGREAMKTL